MAVATGTAIALAAAASAGTSAYASHAAGKTNSKSIAAQSAADAAATKAQEEEIARQKAADDAAAKIKADTLAEQKRQYDAAMAANQGRWSDYLRVNTPMWQAGAGSLKSLYQLAGLGGQAPDLAMPSATAPPPDTTTTTSGGMSDGTPINGSAPGLPGTQSVVRHPMQPMTMPAQAPAGLDLSTLMALANAQKTGGFESTPVVGGT